MKLRAYRKYSIKLMLAWGTCCRFPFTPTIEMKTADREMFCFIYSTRLRYTTHLSRDFYHRWGSRVGGVYARVLPTAPAFRVPWANHQKEVSGGFRSDRMDKAEIWRCDCSLSQPPYVSRGSRTLDRESFSHLNSGSSHCFSTWWQNFQPFRTSSRP